MASYLGRLRDVPERAGYGNDIGESDESGPPRPAEVLVALDVHVYGGRSEISSYRVNGSEYRILA